MSESHLFALFAETDIENLLKHKALMRLLIKKGVITEDEIKNMIDVISKEEREALFSKYRKSITAALLSDEETSP